MSSDEQLSKAFEQALTLKEKPEGNETLAKLAHGLNDFQQAELHQWLTVSSRLPEGVEELNETLKGRSYLLDTQEASVADAVIFSRILPIIKSWTVDEVKAKRHIIRWADQIQNTINVDVSHRVAVNVELEAPREVKAKPKKETREGAPKETVPKETKKEKPEVQQPKNEREQKPVEKAIEKNGVKKEKKKKAPQPVKEEVPITPGMIDLRVGFIEKAVKHPDADSLYVSTIHMGDDEGPRTVCSGLVKYIPIEEMQGRFVVVVANLKPVTMRGIKSQAMVLCASNEDIVEFVNPPEGSKAGDKIFFESYDITPEAVLNPKKKIWETVQPDFATTDKFEVIYKKEGDEAKKLVNKAGQVCLVKSLVGAQVR
jgi:aminoacyl tRNA synthase complex-interacting multifunctional protein 1